VWEDNVQAGIIDPAHMVILFVLAHEMDAQPCVSNYREEVISVCKKCVLWHKECLFASILMFFSDEEFFTLLWNVNS
jgi:hypothetical protein